MKEHNGGLMSVCREDLLNKISSNIIHNASYRTSSAGIWIFMFCVLDLSNKSWKLRLPLRTLEGKFIRI